MGAKDYIQSSIQTELLHQGEGDAIQFLFSVCPNFCLLVLKFPQAKLIKYLI